MDALINTETTTGGFPGMDGKLFAVPWEVLSLDTANKRFVLNTAQKRLENVPGSDKDKRPNMAKPTSVSADDFCRTIQRRSCNAEERVERQA